MWLKNSMFKCKKKIITVKSTLLLHSPSLLAHSLSFSPLPKAVPKVLFVVFSLPAVAVLISWVDWKLLPVMVTWPWGRARSHTKPGGVIRWMKHAVMFFWAGFHWLAAFFVTLPKDMKEDSRNCFRRWPEWWDKRVQREGNSCEGINGNMCFAVIHFKNLNSHSTSPSLVISGILTKTVTTAPKHLRPAALRHGLSLPLWVPWFPPSEHASTEVQLPCPAWS